MEIDYYDNALEYWDYDDVVTILYDPESNRFVLFNEVGEEMRGIVWSIFDLVTPNDVYLFRQYGENMLVPHRSLKGVGVEIVMVVCGDCYYCTRYYECNGEEESEY